MKSLVQVDCCLCPGQGVLGAGCGRQQDFSFVLFTKHSGLCLFQHCWNIPAANNRNCCDFPCISLGDMVFPHVVVFQWIKETQQRPNSFPSSGILSNSFLYTLPGFTLCLCSRSTESIPNKLLVSLSPPGTPEFAECEARGSPVPRILIPAVPLPVLCHRVPFLPKSSVLGAPTSLLSSDKIYFESSSIPFPCWSCIPVFPWGLEQLP